MLTIPPSGRVIDGTLGAGGHSAALLEREPTLELLGLDRDQDALRLAASRLQPFTGRAVLRQAAFDQLAECASEIGWREVDGVLLDVGLSSMQIDLANRGFSYRQDGPLDMRMDRRQPLTASVIVNTWSLGELQRILREYGEEPQARRIASAIVERREQQPWERTGELAELIRGVAGHGRGKRRVPVEARTFQALRIATNDELGQLERALDAAHDLLADGGRLVVIAFHSLEDRLVKQRFRYWAESCICPPGLPVCACDKEATVRVLTRKPITPTQTEIDQNSRAASAKLRGCEKIRKAA